MRARIFCSLTIVLLFLVQCSTLSAYPDANVHAQTIAGLGTATFPTSTRSAAAQTDFIRGLLLLHVFEYPDAAHAQHMCSHIFMALGMWNDVVKANVNATRVMDQQARAAGLPVFDCGHYYIWLEYGYYQQCREQAAERMLAGCERTGTEALTWMRAHPGQPVHTAPTVQKLGAQMSASLVLMRGIAVIESRGWSGLAATMTVDTVGLHGLAGWDAFTTGYAAAERGDRVLAADSLASLNKIAAAYRARPDFDPEEIAYLGILTDDLDGLILSKAGDMDSATAQVQRAAAAYDGMAFDFGPPLTVKPPHELLGEFLLQQKKAPQARQAFNASLKRAPKRTESLLGLARAESAMGDKAAATASYRELLQIWKNADPGYVPVADAQHYVASSSRASK